MKPWLKVTPLLALFLFALTLPTLLVLPIYSASPQSPSTIHQSTTSPLQLVVLYKNGSYFENVAYDSIAWGQVDKVGIKREDLGKVGFEANYGSVLWYPHGFDKPVMFIAQKAWGKIGETWHEFFIQSNTPKSPFYQSDVDGWLLGWKGNITYNALTFPVTIAVKMPYTHNCYYYKTNITTPVALDNVGLEYQLYANPFYKDKIAQYVDAIRLYFNNGTFQDFTIEGQNLDLTYSIPQSVTTIGLLADGCLDQEIAQFNFTDVFSVATSQWLRIEHTTLPNGEETYALKVGCTFGPLNAGDTLEIDPSTISQTANEYSTRYPHQRGTFHHNGRHWAWFCGTSQFYFDSSTDGSSWKGVTSVRACTDGRYFSITFDGTYVHYVYNPNSDGGATYYRRGAPQSDGTINWCDDEQTAMSGESGVYHAMPNIGVDSAGYPWITTIYYNGTYYCRVLKSAWNNGSWNTASGFPIDLDSDSGGISTAPIPLSSQRVFIVWCMTGQVVHGCLWNGASWGSTKTGTSNLESLYAWSAVADSNDDVHVVFNKDVDYDIIHITYDYSGEDFGAETTVHAETEQNIYPSITLESATDKLYCFWGNQSWHWYYKVYDGTWDANPTDWIDESTDHLTGLSKFRTSYKDYGNTIGIVYLSGTVSPYNIRYGYMTTNTPPINDGVTITNMDDTNYLYSMKRYYQFEGLYTDANGPSTLDHVMVAFTDGTNWVNATFDVQANSWSLVSGSTVADIDSGSCTNSTSGNQLTATFHIRLWWNISDATNIELYQFCNDTSGDSDAWEEKQTNYANIETDLSVSGFACDDDRGSLSQTITFTGTVYYQGTSTYPPDSAFTAVHIYDSGDNDKGSDSSIVNGAFSVAFNAPASVGTETYNSYIDMTHASYTDGEDVNTDTFIADNIQVTFAVNSTNPPKGDTILFTVTLTREHDSTNVTSFSFNINRNSTGFNNPHVSTTFTDTNSTEVIYVYDFTAVTDNTYGITSFTDPTDLTVSWFRDYPTMGSFEATSRIYGNDYGFLNLTIVDQDNNITAGTITFENCTLQISGQIIFKWDNTTGTFSIYQDAKGYATLDTSQSTQTTLNVTAYRLSWYVKFGNGYNEGYKGAIATNTLVYDNTDLSASGSQNNYFFYDKEEASQGGLVGTFTPSEPPEKPENYTWGIEPYRPYYELMPKGPSIDILEGGLIGLILIVGGVMTFGLVSRYAHVSTSRSVKKRTKRKRSQSRDYKKRTKRKR